MQDLKLAFVQSDIVWEDKGANFTYYENVFSGLEPNTAMVILPEMFQTGFSFNTDCAEEFTHSITISWMTKMAAKYKCVLAGSFMVKDEGEFYNRLVWMLPNGNFDFYDKRHLFSLSDEPLYFKPGKSKKVFELANWKICPMICYDLRFPVWLRNREKYDLLLFVANWPEKRINHWNSLLQARAIENQCYVLGVNRVGVDANKLTYNGCSQLIDPSGELQGEIYKKEGIYYKTLNHNYLVETRKKLPFLADMDNFSLNIEI